MKLPLAKILDECEVVNDIFEKRTLTMSNSAFNTFSCPVKGLLSYAFKLRPIGASSLAMDYGTSIHAGLAEMMKGKSLEEAKQVFYQEADKFQIDTYDDPRRCTARGTDTLEQWQQWIATLNYPIKAITLRERPAVEVCVIKTIAKEEVSFLGEMTFKWLGIIDAVVEYKGQYWILDHKTTSMLGDRFLDDKIRSNQFLGYYYLMKDIVKKELNVDIAGCLIDAISTGTKDVNFRLYEIPFSPWQIDEWIVSTRRKLLDIVYTISNIVFNPEYEVVAELESCVTKYGRCPFFNVCSVNPRLRDEMLRIEFMKHEHNARESNDFVIEEE